MEYRRPILQEMDTQEYDWVDYILRNRQRSFSTASLAILQERFIYVSTKNSLQIGH